LRLVDPTSAPKSISLGEALPTSFSARDSASVLSRDPSRKIPAAPAELPPDEVEICGGGQRKDPNFAAG